MKMDDLLAEFANEDSITHFTAVSVATEQILFHDQFRFSPFSHVNDPFEYRKIDISYGGMKDPRWSDDHYQRLVADSSTIMWSLSKRVSSLKMGCFSRFSQEKLDLQDYSECFSFSWPNMWAQYADSHKGCALVFSKQAIVESLNTIGFNTFLAENMKYEDLSMMNQMYPHGDYNRLDKLGKESYTKELFEITVKNYIFVKHDSFSAENEFRILLESENDYEFTKVSGTLKAIVVSERTPAFYLDWLKSYCEKSSIPLIGINWSHRSIKYSVL